MPQFELDNVGPQKINGLVRARSADDATRRALNLDDNTGFSVTEKEDLQGWQDVVIDGKASGRIRLHQRMKFRRD